MYIHLSVHASSTLVQDGLADEWSGGGDLMGGDDLTSDGRGYTSCAISINIDDDGLPEPLYVF
jgi:hypothetical protein